MIHNELRIIHLLHKDPAQSLTSKKHWTEIHYLIAKVLEWQEHGLWEHLIKTFLVFATHRDIQPALKGHSINF